MEGNPADEIVNFAEKNDIELIIMGSLGKNRSLAIPTGDCSRKCGQIF
ncbi:MAG: universal stress protein [Methanosarcina sp.]